MENNTTGGGKSEGVRLLPRGSQYEELERLMTMLGVALNPQMIVRDSTLSNDMPEVEITALVETLRGEIESLLEQIKVDQDLAASPFADVLREFNNEFYHEVGDMEAEAEEGEPWSMGELRVGLENIGIQTRDGDPNEGEW